MPRAPRLLDEPVEFYEIDVEVIYTNQHNGGAAVLRFDDGRVMEVRWKMFEKRPTKRGRQTVALRADWAEKRGLI